MASSLVGLFKTLTWNDFQGTPDPTKPKLDAFTSASLTLPVLTPKPAPGGKQFHFEDNVAITIAMNNQKSWKRSANIASRGNQYSIDLLNHEQGHYNLTALLARDLFIEIMQLKAKTYPNPGAALADLALIVNKFNGKSEKAAKKYDEVSQTNHGANAGSQTTWDGMIQKAFTQARTPAVSAPDGTPYKIPILDVLSLAGITL
jgi:hypothetical protein